eukprot:TRINITY_DN37420_c0_g1_i2.p1 TRINITY_DN37420_c0_g1~~TRINITY_DN37420_c0_g1_i2.p1  ORF type:complete len:273 (+),score=94.82 TRINITY_DN37420_c0_g1_i2:113-931(+)
MIRRPPRSTLSSSSAASDVYKRQGYMGEGMESKTEQSIDRWGWLHSGDKGKVDSKGMLYITGRYKELLITAGGENIAPVPVEQRIKDALPDLIETVVMIADKRKFCSCLFTLKAHPGVNQDGQPVFTEALAGAASTLDPDATTLQQACGQDFKGSSVWREALQKGVDQYNQNPVSQAAKIQAFRICNEGFSVGNGMLTDTMKLKRAKVEAAHAPLIELLYAESDLAMAQRQVKKAGDDDQKKGIAEQAVSDASAQLEATRAYFEANYNAPSL